MDDLEDFRREIVRAFGVTYFKLVSHAKRESVEVKIINPLADDAFEIVELPPLPPEANVKLWVDEVYPIMAAAIQRLQIKELELQQ